MNRPGTIESLERFAARVAAAPNSLSPLDIAIDIQRSFDPELKESQVREAVSQLIHAAPALDELPSASAAAAALCDYLHDQHGFVGNRSHYYLVQNSYIGEVLRRRTGIPISLSVLYVAVAAGRGLEASGINFPRNYLVGLWHRSQRALLDPFEGRVVSEAECAERLSDATEVPADLEASLRPADTLTFAVRMLSNLKSIFLDEEHYEQALACCQRILLLIPDSARDIYDLAVSCEQLGSPDAALVELRRLRAMLTDDAVRRALDNKIRTVDEARRPTLH